MIDHFKEVFSKLNSSNLELLKDLYAKDAVFIDPFHRIEGLPALEDYFEGMYRGVNRIQFTYDYEVREQAKGMVAWTMRLDHKKVPGRVKVQGTTYLEFNDKITLHRDYFDAGELLYENIPLFGAVVKLIKARV